MAPTAEAAMRAADAALAAFLAAEDASRFAKEAMCPRGRRRS